MEEKEKFMLRCLELAQNGLGSVYPNPMVGCVIVHDGIIIGEGWHQQAGLPHAEVNAIHAVKDRSLLSEATLYVNLEPCSHHGRTPPCADLILRSGIQKVVIGAIDSNDKVGGRGVRRLRENGVEVTVSVLEASCRELNKRFYTFHEKKRPYIILKWAQSKDGYIFPDKSKATPNEPYWISNAYARQRVHQWRSEEAAILVGKHTVKQDNPRLNSRDFVGNAIIRIAIDRNLELPAHLHFFDGSASTIIYNERKEGVYGQTTYVRLDFTKEITAQILSDLHQKEVQSLIVEGGAYTLNSFIQAGCWDEARIVIGEAHFNGGLKAPVLDGLLQDGLLVKETFIGKNLMQEYKNKIR